MSVPITDISLYFPEKTLDNATLSQEFKVPEVKIFRSTGIRRRFISGDDELASDMAAKVAEQFFSEYKVDRASIDFLILCTAADDFIAPSTSCVLQGRLGLGKHVGTMDIPYCCSAYVYGLCHAKSLISSGMAKNVLLLTSDVSAKTVSAKDLELRSIFSDAASATLITEESAAGIGKFVFGTDGTGWKNLYVSRSAFKDPIDAAFIEEEKLRHGRMVMNGMEIFNFALREVPGLVNDILGRNNMQMDDVDLFVFHQPSRFLLETLRKKINIPSEKFFINIEDYGNTVSTTIPLAMVDAVKQGKLKKDMTILVAGFGIGYSWAGTVIKI